MPEETFVCAEGVASLTTMTSSNKCNAVFGNKPDVMTTHLLQHVKYDFYKKGQDLLIVTVFVKEIDKESLQVLFHSKSFSLKFQTTSKEFLKLHNKTEETIFEWNVMLRHTVDCQNCKYTLTSTKLTMTLKKSCIRDQWNSFEELNTKGDAKNKLMNSNGDIDKITGSQVTEKNTCKIQTKTEHCNGSDVNNKLLDALSLADDTACVDNISNVTTKDVKAKQCVNTDNNKDYELYDKTPGLNHNKLSTDNSACDKTSNVREEGSSEQSNIDNRDFPSRTVSNLLSAQTNLNSINGEVKDCTLTHNKDDRTKEDKDFKKYSCRPGYTGLDNPANRCYMNSVVQCLSSLVELRRYLLSKKYSEHINYDNKNGYGGELISTVNSIIQKLWSGKERVVSALKLKQVIGKKHKQFTHYGQGDAQEFLTFLVDGLHEDLKEEKKKALREDKTDCSKDILESSRRDWEKYINGNTSIISDLFQGQNVSEVHCKECKKPSTGFEYWMQLNIPIPEDLKYLYVYVFFLDPKKKPKKVKVKVRQRARCSDIVTQVSNMVYVRAHRLLLLRSYYSRISHIYDPVEDVSLSSKNDILIACEIVVRTQEVSSSDEKHENNGTSTNEIDMQCTSEILHISIIQRLTHKIIDKCSHCDEDNVSLLYCSRCCKVAYCNRQCQRKDWKHHRQYCSFQPLIIGMPFVISVDASKATLSYLKNKALDYARYSVGSRNCNLGSSKYNLTLLENLTDYYCKGTKLKDKGDTPVVDENVCLALDWEATTRDSTVASVDLICDVHASVNENNLNEDKDCTLEECLKLFWNPESINKECGWRCDHCKDVRAATRKVMICKHPENLIIHLKRFSYSGNGRKISKHIKFPLRGLDMSSFTHPEVPRERTLYDLRAVCSHYGIMNFGHYITFSKPYSEDVADATAITNIDGWVRYDDNKVSSAKESDVEGTQAYILFYHRRKSTTGFVKESTYTGIDGYEGINKTDHCSHPTTRQKIEKFEVKTDQDTTLSLIENNESDSSGCTANGEILLEDILD